jgi:septum formation protein
MPSIRIVLSSASPRRQEMLRDLNIPFKVFGPRVSEKLNTNTSSRKTATDLAIKKCKKYRGRNSLVIGMDTIVTVNKAKLGKPENREDAKRMLSLLNGRTHEVITGVALLWKGRFVTGVASTRVQFRKMTAQEIEWYVQTGEPFDKAGAYAIQGLGRIFVERIEGCYYNVVGFPLTLFQRLLLRFGLRIQDLQSFSRNG